MSLLKKLFELVKFLILAVSSLEYFSELYWNHFSFSFEKFRVDAWQLAKKIKISTTLLSIHNVIIININLFSQVINISVCSAERKIFVVVFVLDIMQFDHMSQFFFKLQFSVHVITNENYWTFPHCAFTCSKSTIETLQQGVKSIQS